MTLTLDHIRELRADAKESARHAYVRGNVDSGRYWEEIDAALAAAETLARMTAWIAADERNRDVEFEGLTGVVLDYGQPDVQPISAIGPTPLAALTAALDQVEGKQ